MANRKKPAEYRAKFTSNGDRDGEDRIKRLLRALGAYYRRKAEERLKGEWRKRPRKQKLTPPNS